MAKQLEVSLYRNAKSFQGYMDMKTLKHRLQMIAMEVSRKAKDQGSRDDRQQGYSNGSRPANREDAAMQSSAHSGTSPPYVNASPGSRRQSSSSVEHMAALSQQMTSQHSRQVKMDEINPMASSSESNGMMRQSTAPAYPMGSSRRGASMEPNPSNRSSTAPAAQASFSQGSRNDQEWQMRVRHKQQRLLLLHHSAKCLHEAGRCTTTPYCADMKRLWRHMEGCKDNNCRVAHCFSSRAILSHYRNCKDVQCPACGPVRETVRKSQAKHSSGMSRNSIGSANSSGPMMNAMLNSSYPPASSSSQLHPMTCPSPDTLAKEVTETFSSVSSANLSFQQQRSTMPPPSQGSNVQYPVSSSAPYHPSGPAASTPSSGAYRAEPSRTDQRSIDPSPLSIASGPSGSSQRRNDSEWQKVRHKQQRLLLLRHASKCQYEAGQCPVTPHCASMKKLWKHIAHCRNQQCTVQHCMSSRYVLSHYRRCKDQRCPACGPVRQTIRQSNEKEKMQPPGSSKALDPEQQLLVSVTADMPPPEPYEPQRKRRKTDHANAITSRKEAVQAPVAAQAPGQAESENSLINSFTMKDIETHLSSLDRTTLLPPPKLKTKCMEVLKGLQNHQHGWVFNNPVDPVELGLPDYFDVIKKPMDLGTIQKKLDSGAYTSIEAFEADVHLTFDNAMHYNEDASVVHDMARELKAKFIVDHKKLLEQLEAEDRERRRNDRACTLCGCEKLLFEPPVFFCNGMNCQSKRIRRNSHFYIGGNNQYFWCNQCYNELDDATPIELLDSSIMKEELKKKKNDEVHEESWVQCDDCECWIHQICGLFNSRQNKEHHSKYFCPKCLLKKKKRGEMTNVPAPPSAAELPRTKLSEQLESHVQAKVEEKIKQLAMEKARMEVRYFGRGLLPLYTVLSMVMLTLFRFVTEHYSVGGEKVA